MELRKCKICQKVFSTYPCRKRPYCSRECFKVGTSQRMMGHRINVGRKQSKASGEKKRIAMLGRHSDEKNPAWKGDKVGYMGLHNWVRRKLGTPQRCDGKNCSGKSTRYHWANKSGKYKRILTDWIRLCVQCHSIFDHQRENKK